MEKRYSVMSLAKIMGIKSRTVRQWIADGRIKAEKYHGSNRWYVSESEIKKIERWQEHAHTNE